MLTILMILYKNKIIPKFTCTKQVFLVIGEGFDEFAKPFTTVWRNSINSVNTYAEGRP